MNVSIFHPNWQVGGVERTNIQWAHHLTQNGFNVTFVTNTDDLNGEAANFANRKLQYSNFKDWISHFKETNMIIFCQSYYWYKILLLIIIAKVLGVSVGLTERNSFEQYQSNRFKYFIYKILFPVLNKIFYDFVIVNSEEMLTEIPFCLSLKKTHVVTNPRFSQQDVETLRAMSRNCEKIPRKVAMYTRWHDQKNIPMIAEMADICNKRSIEFKVYCGRDDEDFQKPMVPDVLEEMLVSPSVIFFCSIFEGFPNILLEARAAGLPVIYSNCPTGVLEIMDGYSNAFLFNYNEPRELEALIDNIEWERLVRVQDERFVRKYQIENCKLSNILRPLMEEQLG